MALELGRSSQVSNALLVPDTNNNNKSSTGSLAPPAAAATAPDDAKKSSSVILTLDIPPTDVVVKRVTGGLSLIDPSSAPAGDAPAASATVTIEDPAAARKTNTPPASDYAAFGSGDDAILKKNEAAATTTTSGGGWIVALRNMFQSSFKVYLALLGVQFCYSIFHVSSSLATKDGANGIQIAVFRNSFGAVPLLFISLYHAGWNNRELINFDRNEWIRVFIYSLLLVPGLQLMVALALQFTSADTSSIMQLLVPVWTTTIAVVTKREEFVLFSLEGALKAGGILCSIFGAIFMIGFANLSGGSSGILVGIIMLLFGTVNMALFVIYSRETIQKHGGSKVVFWIAVMGASTLIVVGLIGGFLSSTTMSKITYVSWLSFMAAGFFSAAGAELLLAWSIPRTSPVVVSVFFTALPFWAAVLSLLIFGELWTIQMAIGAIFLIIGLFSVCYAKYRDAERQKAKNELNKAEVS